MSNLTNATQDQPTSHMKRLSAKRLLGLFLVSVGVIVTPTVFKKGAE